MKVIKVMVGCAVNGCRNRQFKGSGIHFFSFPSDPEQKRIWVDKINRKDYKPTVHSRVCSLHFEDNCFEKDPAVLKSIDWKLNRPKIKQFAVPSIRLKDEDTTSLLEKNNQVGPMVVSLKKERLKQTSTRPTKSGGSKSRSRMKRKQDDTESSHVNKKINRNCECKHTYICDYHKNVIQRARNKRKRSPHSEDENDHSEVVDFAQLQISTLRRYRRHFKLQNKAGMNKSQLLETISRHFKSIPVPEKETITYFIYMVKTRKSKLDQRPGDNI